MVSELRLKIIFDKLVKSQKTGWLSKKNHMRYTRFTYHYGVLEYVRNDR